MTTPPAESPTGQAATDTPIVVIGLMGSGKTTVATLIAERLHRTLRDSDPDMEARYGMTAAETVERMGAEVLHKREFEHLRESLTDDPPSVIAAAASTMDSPDTPALLGPVLVIWLDAPDAVLAERMLSGRHRPHFEADLRAMLAKQRAGRGPMMARVADLTFDVAESRPEEVAAGVFRALEALEAF
ncbi:shikimate kinase [Spongiactinospora sp. TRM90649]|uniref:shikimate kinase n=1 Tax=Spongiactinospora sp. TRM90649 TaxID=3031114 RepID=UPI0023F6F67A|nr:shikimate kinase [Spongiactinospora sp. TRM90649]MDF5753202.1 shikimate kinase [Spongiactinospora sp. TRM90649]